VVDNILKVLHNYIIFGVKLELGTTLVYTGVISIEAVVYHRQEGKMKKACFFVVAVGLALSVIGCGTTGGGSAPAPAQTQAPALGGVPDFVNEAWANASEDVIIGIGSYKIGTDMSKMNTGMTFAQTRARAGIARQLTSIVKDMVNDYTATSELDPSAQASFQENMTQALSKAELKGAKIVKSQTHDGVLWVVMEYSKSLAAEDFNAAAAAAKLAVPAAIAFDALERMDTAFSKTAAGGPSIE
jgi:hypothetical protein